MNQQDQAARVVVPIVIGRNRLRGKSEGPMVYDEAWTDHLGKLRSVLAEEGRHAGVEVTAEWLTKCVSQVLDLYEKELNDHLANKPTDTIGMISEYSLPSGKQLILGDPRVLARAGRLVH